jgi:hypothetical protein
VRATIAAWGALMWLGADPAWGMAPPSLLVLPLDWVDTSGEIPSHANEHADRLAELRQYLSRSLAQAGIYAVVDPTPIAADIAHARAAQPLDACNGCEQDLARLVHADRVLVGEVDKVSTLIGSLRLSIVDVANGQTVFARALSFRGDTDTAWDRAVQFFVRDLAASPPQRH